MSANNQSIKICKEIATINGWDKDGKRNVVTIDGEKWSFSLSSGKRNIVECRQCYEDTVGFITLNISKNMLMYYRMYSGEFNKFNISRVARNGLKSYNVSRHIIEMSTMSEVRLPELV